MGQDWVEDLIEFERAAGARYRTTPGPFREKTSARLRLLREEFAETTEALVRLHQTASSLALANADDDAIDRAVPLHMAAVADGLADLIYVAIGTAITYGIDLRPVWDAVHASNMAKFVDGVVRIEGKVQKPPGWSPPDLVAVLAAQEPLPAPNAPAVALEEEAA